MSENNDIVVELLICDAVAIKPPQSADKTLSLAERRRLDSITNVTQARLFLLGRYLLRQRLSQLLHHDPAAFDISLNNRGKPELASGDWQFNLSHSGSLLALALSPRTAVGVDLETRRLDAPRIARLAGRYLAGAEQRRLANSPHPAHDFQQLWTVKEAVLKAEGGGIANNLDRVEWHPGQPRARFNGQCYRLFQGRLADASLTLAVAGEHSRLRRLELADCMPALEITGPQPNLAINP
ncbi:4'-phosphopantetheinyl transferase superfamily protein [Oceanimonas sp. CHS3-5]|uniref:4'-phosphopantetheinyl transferase family protein n=1 Tax=Oceanimonas sp. CHS3-5 TaxID=3068186 RepID=UPI00273FE70A|nr:4'-phosphopantetheinyl transferase superfamily protein [Oceanimonas sp. CHS3-5]MDP5292715.1 4'-phosphopantetheinyl transferase superfamily protein [Oceanimonas sp. CHS3-5]